MRKVRKGGIKYEHRQAQESMHGERGQWWSERSGETGAGSSGRNSANGRRAVTQAAGAGQGLQTEMGRLSHLPTVSISHKYGTTHQKMPFGRRSLVEGHASREANVQMMMRQESAVGWLAHQRIFSHTQTTWLY